jgi:hypothetical protein
LFGVKLEIDISSQAEVSVKRQNGSSNPAREAVQRGAGRALLFSTGLVTSLGVAQFLGISSTITSKENLIGIVGSLGVAAVAEWVAGRQITSSEYVTTNKIRYVWFGTQYAASAKQLEDAGLLQTLIVTLLAFCGIYLLS